MDRDLTRRVDSQTDLITSNIYNRNYDIIANDYALVALPGQHKH